MQTELHRLVMKQDKKLSTTRGQNWSFCPRVVPVTGIMCHSQIKLLRRLAVGKLLFEILLLPYLLIHPRSSPR
jgi:hypothetical protein